MVQQINTKYNNYAFTYYYISLYWLQISKMGDFGPYNDMYFNPATFYDACTNPGSEWLCISVLGVSILPVSTFFDQILELSRQCDIFFTLYLKSKNLYSNLWTYWNTNFCIVRRCYKANQMRTKNLTLYICMVNMGYVLTFDGIIFSPFTCFPIDPNIFTSA